MIGKWLPVIGDLVVMATVGTVHMVVSGKVLSSHVLQGNMKSMMLFVIGK